MFLNSIRPIVLLIGGGLLCTFVFAMPLKKDSQALNTQLTDAYITFRVEGAILQAKLFQDPSIPLVSINATTHHGVVVLTGQVPKQSGIDAILNQTQRLHGVKKIVSHLKVVDTRHGLKS